MIAAIVLTAALYAVPYGRYVAYPLLLISTFVHEMGHGVAAELVGGGFDSFVMHLDGSGMAQISGVDGRLAGAIVAAGGLLGPAVVAALFFAMSSRADLSRLGLALFSVAALISCVWVVRSVFGWLFVGLLAAACLILANRASKDCVQFSLALLAVQLAMSVYSRGGYLFTDVVETSGGMFPSDVALIAQALVLPYWFWGGFCALVSAAVLVWGVSVFWRASRAMG
jgi:hypothetical protein